MEKLKLIRMKKILFTLLLSLLAGFSFAQTTYYWVGGLAGTTGINTGANWNTDPGGMGSPRPSSSGATDILIFDGTNLGGSTPATGSATTVSYTHLDVYKRQWLCRDGVTTTSLSKTIV